MAVRQFAFDEGFSQVPPTGGLAFNFSRGVATVDPVGGGVLAGDARFHVETRLLCGAPDVRVDIPADGNVGGLASPVAAGFSADGVTPLLAVFFGDPQNLVVYSVGMGGTLTAYASSPSSASITFPPDSKVFGEDSSFAICQGMLYRVCKVTNVQARSTAIIWANLVPPSPLPTTVVWQAPTNVPADSQLGLNRGAAFQHTGYCVFPEDIDANERISRVWIPFADYVKNETPKSDIGRFFLATASRGSSGPWTMEPTTLVYETVARVTDPTLPDAGQHAHNAFVERFGEEGLRMVMAVGDFQTSNRVLSATCANEGDYDTVTWTKQPNLHGEWMTSVSQPVCGDGNQFVGSAALGKYTEYAGRIIGSDEMIVPLSRLVVPESADDRYNFTRLYGGPTSSFNRPQGGQPNFVWNTFFVMKPTTESSGPYVAWVCPGNQTGNGWNENDAARRVLFSPDGLHWGQAWAPNDGEANQPIQTIADRIFMHSRTGRGLRSIPVPAYRLFKPLLVGVGGTNLLSADADVIGGTIEPDADNVTRNAVTLVDRATLDAAGVTKPPCLGRIFKCVAGGFNGSRIGIFRLTQSNAINPVVSKLIKVRAWIYPLPWADEPTTFETATANCLGLAVALGRADAPGDAIATFAAAREQVVVGPLQTVGDSRGWIPITFDTDAAQWRDETVVGQPVNAPNGIFDLAIRLRTGLGGDPLPPRNPHAFLIAFDSVTTTAAGVTTQAAPYPGYALAPVATGATPALTSDEIATVTGFTCTSSWTIEVGGLLGDSGRDALLPPVHRQTPMYVCTLRQDVTRFIRLSLDMTTGAVVVTIQAPSATTSTISILPTPIDDGPIDASYLLRGSPVLLAISRSGGSYQIVVSVGGSSMGYGWVQTSASVNPTSIQFGDQSATRSEAMEWFGGRIDTTKASTGDELAASLQGLEFLTGGVE